MLEELELLLKAAGIKFTRAGRTINGWDAPWSAWVSPTGYSIMYRSDRGKLLKPSSLGVQATFDRILKCEARR
jgi:hypothetical protein